MDYYLQPKQILHGFELPNPESLRVQQVADVLQSSTAHVYNLVNAGELAAINIAPGKQVSTWRISRASLVDFIERRTTGPTAAVDFKKTESPHDFELPERRLLGTSQLTNFLSCSPTHISNLVDAGELVATNIAVCETGKREFRFPRAGLVHFINARTEGAY